MTQLQCPQNVSENAALKGLIVALRDEMVTIAGRYFPQDAEDIAQESLNKAIDRLAQFRGDTEAQLRAWVRTIVRNMALSRLRRKDLLRPAADVTQSPIEGAGATPAEELRRQEERSRLKAMLTELSETERDVLFLRYFEDWPLKSIAAQIGRTDMAVAGILKRSLQKLRSRTSLSQWSRLL